MPRTAVGDSSRGHAPDSSRGRARCPLTARTALCRAVPPAHTAFTIKLAAISGLQGVNPEIAAFQGWRWFLFFFSFYVWESVTSQIHLSPVQDENRAGKSRTLLLSSIRRANVCAHCFALMVPRHLGFLHSPENHYELSEREAFGMPTNDSRKPFYFSALDETISRPGKR